MSCNFVLLLRTLHLGCIVDYTHKTSNLLTLSFWTNVLFNCCELSVLIHRKDELNVHKMLI